LNIRSQEDNLFSRWRQHRERFYRDGAGCHFEQETMRVLFLLKEGNDEFGDFVDDNDIRDLLSHPKSLATWKNVARWAALALDNALWSNVEHLTRDSMPKYLERVVAMNLKKSSGRARTRSKELWEHADADKEFIVEQVNLYRPHLTIACGTYGYMKAIDPSIERQSQRYLLGHPAFGTIVDCYHPQARRSHKLLYENLSSILLSLRDITPPSR
jgi:hypothetical protein